MRLQSRWQCEAFSLCPFLATSAFNLHYLPAEFSVIQQKFPLVLITPQADPVMFEQLWRMFEICSDTRELLLAVFSPDSFWKREETQCSWLDWAAEHTLQTSVLNAAPLPTASLTHTHFSFKNKALYMCFYVSQGLVFFLIKRDHTTHVTLWLAFFSHHEKIRHKTPIHCLY